MFLLRGSSQLSMRCAIGTGERKGLSCMAEREGQSLVKRPLVKEDTLQEAYYRIWDSRQYEYVLDITWWDHVRENLGYIHTVRGMVIELNADLCSMKIKSGGESVWIDLDSILEIRAGS